MNDTMRVVLPVFLTIAIPSLMVCVSILTNKQDVTRLDNRITDLGKDVKSDFAKVEAKFDKLEGKIDRLSDLIHQGILNLNIKAGEDDTRISLLEERTKNLK
jgi:GTP-binding protein EngB required for normal cell division